MEAAFANYPTKLEISKTDITGEYELKGATLSIIDKDGNVVLTAVNSEQKVNTKYQEKDIWFKESTF